jgi:signal transduction histidine kinase
VRLRLMLAFVGLVAVVLVIAGAGGIILTHNAARAQATRQLVTEAKSLNAATSQTQRLRVLNIVRKVLSLEDARVIRVSLLGKVESPLPPGLTTGDIDAQSLAAGRTVSGSDGNLVFAVAPISLTPREQAQLAKLRLEGRFAVALTRQVGDVGPSWGYFFISGVIALVIAALVAWQLSRRMARPLVEATQATARIAAGDLQSRVPRREDDFSESSSLARSINEMAQSLEDGRSRERHLLLSISHDLRTPLTSIRGFAEALSDGATTDVTYAAGVIGSSARRLERLVTDLLELAKLESGAFSLHSGTLDLSDVVTQAAQAFEPAAGGLGVSIELETAGAGEVLCVADPDRVGQVVANLVENALKYAASCVTVGTRRLGQGWLEAFVEDDGPGIPGADLERVFERLYQSRLSAGRELGSGLGLAIVDELVKAMGGKVRAESPTGAHGGTRVIVVLPAAPGVAG